MLLANVRFLPVLYLMCAATTGLAVFALLTVLYAIMPPALKQECAKDTEVINW